MKGTYMGIVSIGIFIMLLILVLIMYWVAKRDMEINKELDGYEEMIINDEVFWSDKQ